MSISPITQSWGPARFALVITLSWVIALGLSARDAVPSLLASFTILKQSAVWETPKNLEESLHRQRQIQAHYLSYGVYIPLDDIVLGDHDTRSRPLMTPTEGVCGSSMSGIWVPVAFHFPIFGEKVFEWCLVRT